MLKAGAFEEFGLLRAVKSKNYRTFKIWAFDTENDKEGNITLINFFDGNNHFSFFPQKQGFKPFFNWLYTKPNKKNSLLVAHNLEYDITNCFRDSNFHLVKEMLYGGSRVITANLKEHKAQLIDSFNFFAGTLKKMGEAIGLEKGDFEEASKDEKDLLKYCRRDCEILWSFMHKLQVKVNCEDNITLPVTIGRLALDSFRANFLEKDYQTYNSLECLKAYAGGRVECFKIGSFEGEIKFADVKSMYPTNMLRDYPDCATLESGVDPRNTIYGIAECEIFVPNNIFIGPLWQKVKGKLCFPTGHLRGFWTFHEIRTALEFGAVFKKLHWSIGTNIGIKNLFSGYILENFERRKNSQNDFENIFYKLKMNNGYGKLIQHNDSTVLSTELINPSEREKNNLELKDMLGPFYVYNKSIEKPPKFACFLWGSYITAFARDMLFRALNKVHTQGHELLYCDTDSIAYIKKNEKEPLKLGSNLGEWENENFVKAQIFTLKGYCFETKEGKQKIASKGVKNTLALDFFAGKKVQFEKPMKLKEAIRQGILPNLWKINEKQKVSEFDKRIVLDNGDTKPLFLKNIEESISLKENKSVYFNHQANINQRKKLSWLQKQILKKKLQQKKNLSQKEKLCLLRLRRWEFRQVLPRTLLLNRSRLTI